MCCAAVHHYCPRRDAPLSEIPLPVSRISTIALARNAPLSRIPLSVSRISTIALARDTMRGQ
jgi:hypothetical protein